MQKISEELNKILKDFSLEGEKIERLADEVKKVSSQNNHNYISERLLKLPKGDWNLLDDISDKIWYSDLTISEKINLGLEFYDLFPTYYQGLNPIHIFFRDGLIKENELRSYIFDRFAKYISSEEKYFVNSVGYILWVEFFEGGDKLSREAWNSIVNSNNMTLLGKHNLLEHSGPADFDLKEKLYDELFPNKESHPYIFDSLLYSATDLYGKINKERVVKILSKLEGIDKESKEYQILETKLK